MGNNCMKRDGRGSEQPTPLPHPGNSSIPLEEPSTPDKLNGSVNGNASPTPQPPGSKIVVALYPYDPRMENDLSFEKGDQILIKIDSDNDWWFGQNLRTKEEGYIPSNFVAGIATIQSEEWYLGKLARKEAERMLLSTGNDKGTFLVRESETSPGAYAISVLTEDPRDLSPVVKHYKVRHMNDGKVYVSTKSIFPTLDILIMHYAKKSDGLCCRLMYTCPRDKPAMWDLTRQTKEMWEMDRSLIKKSRLLGKGNFGEVWHGYCFNVQIEIAIKTLHPDSMSAKAFLEEAAIMKNCRHPKLVQLYGVCSKDEPIWMIMEYMCNGALLDYLRGDTGKSLTLTLLVDMAAQVANGMSYLEREHMIHRDLAARNVLVGEKNVVKIADFGLARALDENVYSPRKGGKFPIKWTAPEAAMRDMFSIKSDVWSYGILLYEIFSRGQNPYPGMSNHEVLQQVERGFRLQSPDFSKLHNSPKSSEPHPIYEIMLKCWAAEPDDRPTFAHLYDFFDDFKVSTEPSYSADNF